MQEEPYLSSSASVIFNKMKTNQKQTEVTLDEVIINLTLIFRGILTASDVNDAVHTFISDQGISSEVSCMTKNEFKNLLNRIIDDWMAGVDKDGNGAISKKEFIANVKEVMGWQSWLVVGHMKKTFHNVAKHVDADGDGQLSKSEIVELLRMFAEGELNVDKVISLPAIMKI